MLLEGVPPLSRFQIVLAVLDSVQPQTSVSNEQLVAWVDDLDGQPVHAAAPVSALKSPAEQAVKGLPFGPVYPAFATQPVLVAVPVPATPKSRRHH